MRGIPGKLLGFREKVLTTRKLGEVDHVVMCQQTRTAYPGGGGVV